MILLAPSRFVQPRIIPIGSQDYPTFAGVSVGTVTQNRAYYLPWVTATPFIITKFACYNGSTVNGNIDMGLYDVDGNRLLSTGSTAQSGASQVQEVDITDFYVSIGRYFVAFASNSATATFLRGGGANLPRIYGWREQDTAFPLPATATFANWSAGSAPIAALFTASV